MARGRPHRGWQAAKAGSHNRHRTDPHKSETRSPTGHRVRLGTRRRRDRLTTSTKATVQSARGRNPHLESKGAPTRAAQNRHARARA
eukprot:14023561-Alexandrium_andersonii.AAC.1